MSVCVLWIMIGLGFHLRSDTINKVGGCVEHLVQFDDKDDDQHFVEFDLQGWWWKLTFWFHSLCIGTLVPHIFMLPSNIIVSSWNIQHDVCMYDSTSYLPSRLYKYTERYEVIQPESSILLLIKALKNQEENRVVTCTRIFWTGSAVHKN